MMRVRLFSGERWSGAVEIGYYEMEALPATGHKIALAADAGWRAATVRDVAHRLTDPEQAADVALLVGGLTDEDAGRHPLPLAAFDRLADGVDRSRGAAVTVPRAGPWSG